MAPIIVPSSQNLRLNSGSAGRYIDVDIAMSS